jgi:hypothetical protein
VINPALFKKAAAVDTNAHQGWRIAPSRPDWSVAGELNAMFIASVEFGDACVEYPIVFVNAGNDPQGNRQIAPVAVFGLREKENLYLTNELLTLKRTLEEHQVQRLGKLPTIPFLVVFAPRHAAEHVRKAIETL